MTRRNSFDKSILYDLEKTSVDELKLHDSAARQEAETIFRRSGKNGPYCLAIIKHLQTMAAADIDSRKPREPAPQPETLPPYWTEEFLKD